jgi:chitinase
METGTQDRKEVVYKITNLVDGTNFTKFDVVTEDFGVMTFVVNKDKTTNRDLLVQFKEKNKTYVAVVNM